MVIKIITDCMFVQFELHHIQLLTVTERNSLHNLVDLNRSFTCLKLNFFEVGSVLNSVCKQ